MASSNGKHFKQANTSATNTPSSHMHVNGDQPAQSGRFARQDGAVQSGHTARPGKAPHDIMPVQQIYPQQGVNPVRPTRSARNASQNPYHAYAANPGNQSSRPTHSAYHEPSSNKRKRSILPTVLICIGVVLLLVAGGLFVKAQMGYKEAASYYDGLGKDAIKDTDTDGVPKVDFAALKAESNDIVGWIYIPNTQVNYVVAQGKNNNQYLRHLPNGSYNMNGTVFLDAEQTAPGVVDQQTTLYGHHMNDGSMFQFIDETMQQKTFDTVEKVYYITDGTTYVFKPMFTMQVQDDYIDARMGNFGSEVEFRQYLQASLAQAKASSNNATKQVDEAKQVLTLITCAGEIIPRTTRAGMVCTLVDSYAN